MATIPHLAATLLLTGALAHAQVSSPDKLVGHPPPPPQQQRPQIADDLQWLWPFTKPAPLGRADDLRLDARFQSLLPREFKQQQAMWGADPDHRLPLSAVIALFLAKDGTVTAEQNRYISIDGCVPSFCSAEGLLWFDLGGAATRHPLMVFAAVNWDAEGHTTAEPTADYNLWLFPNRNTDPDALPFALTQAIAHWNIRLAAAHRLVPHIAHALLVEPNGSPYALDPGLTGANVIAPQPDSTR